MSDKFKEEIRTFISEEAHRNVKLKKQRKEESRKFQKSKQEIFNHIEYFEDELNQLLTRYDQMNESSYVMMGNFFSDMETGNYETIEKNLGDILLERLNNLKSAQTSIVDKKVDQESSLKEYQTSMYLRHEAKMIEMEKRAELASLDAEIYALKFGGENDTSDEDDQKVDEIIKEIRWRSRELLIAETSLEIETCLDTKLQCQRKMMAMVEDLAELWQRQSIRVKVRLAALEQEIGMHRRTLDTLASVSGLVGSLTLAKDQLAKMERLVTAGDNLYSDDDQLLIRVQNKLTESFAPLARCLDSTIGAVSACRKQRDDNEALLLELVDNLDVSRSCLENISDNAGALHAGLRDNRAPGGSGRLSLLERPHYDEYVRAVAESDRLKERLKAIKDDESRLRVDAAL